MSSAPRRTPPGPKGRPLIGHGVEYMRDPLGFMLRVRREYGGLVGLHLPSMKVWLVSDPALIEQVLVTDTKSYRKDRAIRFLGNEVIGQGLLSREGDLWRRQRSAMSDAQLRDEVMTMLLAGHETTALLLSYSFLLLTQNPGAMAALAAELASALGGRVPSHSDLPALRYTEAVLLETMRLYPPAWTIGREVASDTELGGYPLAKGTQVLMSQWVLHRDPGFFPEPESFRPERWLDGLQKRLPRFAYMPFGGGPRLCIGHSFALIEATLLLASIASRFRLRVDHDPSQPLRFLLAVTLRPRDGLSARVETP